MKREQIKHFITSSSDEGLKLIKRVTDFVTRAVEEKDSQKLLTLRAFTEAYAGERNNLIKDVYGYAAELKYFNQLYIEEVVIPSGKFSINELLVESNKSSKKHNEKYGLHRHEDSFTEENFYHVPLEEPTKAILRIVKPKKPGTIQRILEMADKELELLQEQNLDKHIIRLIDNKLNFRRSTESKFFNRYAAEYATIITTRKDGHGVTVAALSGGDYTRWMTEYCSESRKDGKYKKIFFALLSAPIEQ